MDVGKLNRTIIIQKKECIVDDNGFQVESWIDIATVHCMITNIHGKELVDNIDLFTTNTYKRAKFRYKKYLDANLYPNVTIDYRIKYRNSIWNITSIDDIKDAHQYMEVLITKVEGEY